MCFGWSNTQITVQVPDSPSLFPQGPVVDVVGVQAGGFASNTDFLFQLENHINTATNLRGSNVITVTVKGTSLRNDPGSLFRSTYYEHVSLDDVWVPNSSVKAWSNNVITFVVPLSTTAGSLTITSNGFQSNALSFDPGGFKIYLPFALKGNEIRQWKNLCQFSFGRPVVGWR